MHYTISKEAVEHLALALSYLDNVEQCEHRSTSELMRASHDAKRCVINAASELLTHAQKVV